MDYKKRRYSLKRVGTGLLLLMSFGSMQAQFPGGIFSQGATELKDNAAQILALQALGTANQDDYEALGNGLEDIGDIHGAEYTLHRQYFASLSAVNPQIAEMPEVSDIISMVTALTFSTAIGNWTATGKLTPAELNAIMALDTNLSRIGQAELKTLQTLLTPGELTLSDAQRMKAIKELDNSVHEQYEFMEQVGAETDLLIANRKKL